MTSIIQSLKPKDEISLINYEELERKWDIHKYYPKFFHNDGVATPEIKKMIGQKPIYSKANEHLDNWVNPGIKKVYETELDYSSGKLKINRQYEEGTKRERRLFKSEARQEAKAERQEARLDRQEARVDRQEAKLEDKLAKKREKIANKRKLEDRRRKIQSKEKPKMIQFNNPFGQEPAALENPHQHIVHHSENKRNNSISSKLMNFISNNSDDLEIVRTSSYDQTKSSLTSSRKKSLFRKRYSEQIGMYNPG